ncbi:MAG: FliM/FliN family flagellar motor switch protein [Planctomycetota bacterium]|jgi:flagellar motor switch protein FliN/FliY
MPADLESILKLEVPVIVEIANRLMPVDEVLNLAPGAIIELPRLVDEPLDLLVSNKQIGVGSAVKVGENFGIRVAFIGDLRKRIEALGAAPPETAEDAGAEAAADASAEPAANDDETAPPGPEEAAAE